MLNIKNEELLGFKCNFLTCVKKYAYDRPKKIPRKRKRQKKETKIKRKK